MNIEVVSNNLSAIVLSLLITKKYPLWLKSSIKSINVMKQTYIVKGIRK